MRTSRIRAFVHRQLDGRLLPRDGRALLVDHLDEVAAAVAACHVSRRPVTAAHRAGLIEDLDGADPETWWYAVETLRHARPGLRPTG